MDQVAEYMRVFSIFKGQVAQSILGWKYTPLDQSKEDVSNGILGNNFGNCCSNKSGSACPLEEQW